MSILSVRTPFSSVFLVFVIVAALYLIFKPADVGPENTSLRYSAPAAAIAAPVFVDNRRDTTESTTSFTTQSQAAPLDEAQREQLRLAFYDKKNAAIEYDYFGKAVVNTTVPGSLSADYLLTEALTYYVTDADAAAGIFGCVSMGYFVEPNSHIAVITDGNPYRNVSYYYCDWNDPLQAYSLTKTEHLDQFKASIAAISRPL